MQFGNQVTGLDSALEATVMVLVVGHVVAISRAFADDRESSDVISVARRGGPVPPASAILEHLGALVLDPFS
jgi:hypothetical protein